jgi:hypothetical protein
VLGHRASQIPYLKERLKSVSAPTTSEFFSPKSSFALSGGIGDGGMDDYLTDRVGGVLVPMNYIPRVCRLQFTWQFLVFNHYILPFANVKCY